MKRYSGEEECGQWNIAYGIMHSYTENFYVRVFSDRCSL